MTKINLFISYSRDDKQYLPELLTSIEGQSKKIVIWYDKKIPGGSEWDDDIKEKLNTADIVLLLLSPFFLNSKFIRENELPIAIKRSEARECVVVPIRVRSCILDNYPEIKKLQGFPREGFLSDMEEKRWTDYVEIVQELNILADKIETDRNILNSIISQDEKAGPAKEIEKLNSKRKIFLSIPDSDEGIRARRDFIVQVEDKIKYDGWPYEVVPKIVKAEELFNKSEKEIADTLNFFIGEAIYSIHIIQSAKDLVSGINKMQYDIAKKYSDSTFFKKIIWLIDSKIKVDPENEISTNPIAKGNDYDYIFELIKYHDGEKERKLEQLKKGFSTEKKIYMFYDFSKDHNSKLRIKLKSKIEENENLSVRFSLPNSTPQEEREDLKKCEGGCIFYGASDPQWFIFRQSILLDAENTQSKAVCVDEPEIDIKIQRDVIKNNFMIIKGQTDFEIGVENFLQPLKTRHD